MAARKEQSSVRHLLVLIALLCIVVIPGPAASAEGSGFRVNEGRLLDAYGNDFIMRGVNHPHSWFEGRIASLDDIKATGANTARIVLSTGARFARSSPQDITRLTSRCRQVRLICVFEVHDTTGYPEVDGSISLDAAVDFWIDNIEELAGQESYVIINIGNEPFGNERFTDWSLATQAAVRRMRDAGFTHTLMVDAPNWGQDWSFTMRDNASAVLKSDPDRNLVFDIHMYGVFDDAHKVRTYLEHFARENLALVIGEFGATHTDGDPDETAIMHWAELYGIGYLAWSWSGNTMPVADLNIVRDFAADDLTAWGSQVLNSTWGITPNATEATVFGEPVAAPPPLLAQVPTVIEQVVAEPSPVLWGQAEAEDAVRNGLRVSVRGAGFSGSGFLTGFDAVGDSVTMTVHVDRAARYDLMFGYRSSFGDKAQQVTVNGTRHGGLVFPQSTAFGKVSLEGVDLNEGANHISVAHDWGWIDLDYVQVWGPDE